MRALIVLVIVAFGLAAAIRGRFPALLLYVWFAIFRPQEWSYRTLNFLHLSLVIGIVLVVPCMITGIFPNVTHPLSAGMILFLAWGAIAQLGAVDPSIGLSTLDDLFRLVLVSLLAVTLVTTRRRLWLLMAVMAGSLGLHAAQAGVGFVLRGGDVRFADGIGGMFGDNNGFALGIARIVFLLLGVAQTAPTRWVRVGFLAAVPLSILGMIGTFSRGAFLAVAAATVVFVMLHRRRGTALVTVTIVMLTALLVVPIPERYFDRLETILTYEEVEEQSALGRLHFWRVAVMMAQSRFFGVGLGNFEPAYELYDFSGGQRGTDRAVHSSHFEVLAETGFGGLIIFEAIWLYAIYVALRVRRRARDRIQDPQEQRFYTIMANALIASTVAFLVGGSFLSQSLNDLNWFTLALLASLDRLSKASAMAAESVQVASTHAVTTIPAPQRAPAAVEAHDVDPRAPHPTAGTAGPSFLWARLHSNEEDGRT